MKQWHRCTLLIALLTLTTWWGLPSTTYGQAIGPTFVPNQTFYQAGDSVKFWGPGLWDAMICDILLFRDTVTNDTFFFSSSLGEFTGTDLSIDTLRFQVPVSLPCGVFEVRLNYNLCGASGFSNSGVYIDIRDIISVTYPGTGILCMGDTNPLPVSLLDTPRYMISSGPPGAQVDSITGAVLVQSGGLGSFTVRAYTSNNATCNDEQFFNFTLNNMSPSTISYVPPTVGYCPLDLTAAPTSGPPPVGSNFASIPGVTWANQSAGVINVATTPPGFYSIIYQPPHDLCQWPDTASIKINQKATPAFDYLTQYCEGDTAAVPAITNLPIGSFVMTAGPGPLFINGTTGAIDLGQSAPGSYIITYQPSVACADSVSDNVNIYDTQEASFFFFPDTVCTGTPTVSATGMQPSGGYFRDTSTANNVVINPATGVVDVAASTPGGPYFVFYVNGDPVCPDSATSLLTILPRDSFSIYYPKSNYCRNENDPSPSFASGSTGGQFIYTSTSTLSINATTGVIDLDNSLGGVFHIKYISPNTDCRDTITVDSFFTINTVSSANFSLPNFGTSDTLCEGSGKFRLQSIAASGTARGYVVTGPNGPIPGAVVNDSIDTSVIPPGGPYPVTRWVSNGVCLDSVTRYLTIFPREDASFYYVNDTLCGDATNPIPLITGNGGGTFSNAPGDPINVNPNTGLLNLSVADGTFVIRYVTPGLCKDTAYSSITVLPANSAQFEYAGQPSFCTFDSIIVLDSSATFVPGGVFTYTSQGGSFLHLDSLNGTILLDSSGTGSFTIRYSLNSAVCATVFQNQITINASDDTTTMAYPQFLYCPTDQDPTPIVIGDQNGEFLAVPGINFVDTLGTISLQNSTPRATPYVIRYHLPGDCPRDVEDSIQIQSATPSTFNYASSFFCTTDTNPQPFITTAGGTFYAEDDFFNIVQYVDPQTGTFFLDSVQGNNEIFYIYYNSGAGCTSTYSQTITVFQGPEGADLEPDSLGAICDGDTLTFSASGSEREYKWFVNGVQVPLADLGTNLATFESNSFTDSSVVMVVYENLAGCRDTLSQVVRVNPTPLIVIPDTSITVSGGQDVEIDVISFLDNSFLEWQAASQANIDFSLTNDLEGPVNNGETYTIRNQLGLSDSTNPALVIFTVTPHAQTCTGEPVLVYVKVNPNDQPIFIPELITPNADGLNDRWLIQLRNDVREDDYTMLLFNRSGGQVLRMTPLNQNFDGEMLPDGVYWYKLLDNRNGATLRTGGLTIRRK